eukprot:6283631-Amphidinium_carterae.3
MASGLGSAATELHVENLRCRIVHHDVKPDNFLCTGPGNLVVKLCDFGLARTLPKRLVPALHLY